MRPAAVVADANVVLSALIGGRAGLIFIDPEGPDIVGPAQVAEEVLEYLPKLAAKHKLNEGELIAALQLLPITWHDVSVYGHREEEARNLVEERDPEDWPVVALALELRLPIWSQDKDIEATGLESFTTGDLLDASG